MTFSSFAAGFGCAALGLALAGVSLAGAEDAASQETDAALSLELNAVQQNQSGCRVTFVVNNGLDTDLTKAAFEFAIFDRKGIVDRLAVLDFKELPKGKTKVTRFDLPSTQCDGIGRILVNSVTGCEGPSVTAEICISGLATSTRANVIFGK